jgi:hypothetical protein
MKTWLMGCLLPLLVMSGCATRVDPGTLGDAVRRHTDVGLNHVFYMGSRGEDHFLQHQHAWGSRVYRVSARDVIIEPVFPFTRDPEAWRLIAARWWPEPSPGEPLFFSEEAPVQVEDSGRVRMSPVSTGD